MRGVVGHSGAKDSMAMLLHLLDKGHKVTPVFWDTVAFVTHLHLVVGLSFCCFCPDEM